MIDINLLDSLEDALQEEESSKERELSDLSRIDINRFAKKIKELERLNEKLQKT